MSGGHFDYQQHMIMDHAEEIEKLIKNNDVKDEWEYSQDYTPETLVKFQEAADLLKTASAMLHRIDWLVSGDDGEESFHKRWMEDDIINKANENS